MPKGLAKVTVGKSNCVITSINDSLIGCNLSLNGAGAYPVIVQITNQGISNSDQQFTFDLIVANLSSSGGGIY